MCVSFGNAFFVFEYKSLAGCCECEKPVKSKIHPRLGREELDRVKRE